MLLRWKRLGILNLPLLRGWIGKRNIDSNNKSIFYKHIFYLLGGIINIGDAFVQGALKKVKI